MFMFFRYQQTNYPVSGTLICRMATFRNRTFKASPLIELLRETLT